MNKKNTTNYDSSNFSEICIEMAMPYFKKRFFDFSLINDEHELTPIEDCLFRAIQTRAYIKKIRKFDVIHTTEKGNKRKLIQVGFFIIPQCPIDQYRVDFLIQYGRYDATIPEYYQKSIIVECDSQMFHERSENERRYEKKRDRYFAKKGYCVYHFTGKEILENPFLVADEIINGVVEK
jgi:very-short-patch-repair endonuclease